MKNGMPLQLPDVILPHVQGMDFARDEIGMSTGSVLIYEDRVLKVEDVRTEWQKRVDTLRWLEGKLPVPKVIASCHENGKSYLLMSRMKGHMGCDPKQMEKPEELHRLLAEGLKLFWQVDASQCPRVRTIEDDLRLARYRVEHDLIEEFYQDAFGDEHFQSPRALLDYLENHVPAFDPVMSHGDYCLPNVLMEEGRLTGFIDLGDAAMADRYCDIADCYRSLKGNFGGWFTGKVYPGYDPDAFLRALPVPVDREKLRFQLLLNNLL